MDSPLAFGPIWPSGRIFFFIPPLLTFGIFSETCIMLKKSVAVLLSLKYPYFNSIHLVKMSISSGIVVPKKLDNLLKFLKMWAPL